MTNPRPLLSVIIPIYKTNLDFVKSCLAAIANQTYTPIEVIIVDDGNEATYLEALEKLTAAENIRLIHQDNQGAGAAKNKALSQIKGELVTFVDADDIPAANYCELLVNDLLSTKSEIAIFRYSNTLEGELPPKSINANFIKNMFCGELQMGIPAKIFSVSFLKRYAIRFPEHVLSEERHFLVQCFHYAKAIYYNPTSIYARRQHPESTMGNITIKDVSGLTRLCEMDVNFLQKHNADQTLLLQCYLAHYRVLRYCYYKIRYSGSWAIFLPSMLLSNIYLKIGVDILHKVFLIEVRFRAEKLLVSSLIHKLIRFY